MDTEELEKRIVELERNNDPAEKLPSLQLSDPLLSIDFPEEDQPRKKRLRVRVKVDDANMESSTGVSYKKAPSRKEPSITTQKLLRKGAKQSPQVSDGSPPDATVGGDGKEVYLYDEVVAETTSEPID